jgi:hypothetical protein
MTVSDSVNRDVPIERKAVISKKNFSTNKPSPAVEPDENVKPVPFPRKCGTIKVHFTARAFPTPKRESQAPEEEEVISFYRLYKILNCVSLLLSFLNVLFIVPHMY